MESQHEGIAGQPGYSVSRDGRVYSVRSGRYLKGSNAGHGYRFVQFPNGEREYIHRLICRAFHGEAPEGKPEVRHLDGNKKNNAASNLCWGSRQDNEADKARHGTTAKGERNPQAKLNRAKVEAMRARRASTGLSYAKLALEFGVSTMTAFRAATKESWK